MQIYLQQKTHWEKRLISYGFLLDIEGNDKYTQGITTVDGVVGVDLDDLFGFDPIIDLVPLATFFIALATPMS